MAKFLIVLFISLFFSCVSLLNPNASLQEPVVVITFDDGHKSIYSVAYKRMREVDTAFAASHFLPVTYVGRRGCVTLDQLKEMEQAGWETGGHGYTHENLSSVSLDSAEKQIKASYDFLSANNLSKESFAYPWGNYNYEVGKIVMKWFKNIRTSHDFFYLDGINRKELGYYAVKGGHSGDDIISRVEQARSAGSPLVIVGFHAVIPDDANPLSNTYWCKESVFVEFLEYLKKQELPVLTVKEAMSVLCR